MIEASIDIKLHLTGHTKKISSQKRMYEQKNIKVNKNQYYVIISIIFQNIIKISNVSILVNRKIIIAFGQQTFL